MHKLNHNQQSLASIATMLNAKYHGDAESMISGIASLSSANSQQITFLNDKRFRNDLPNTQAGAVLLREEDLMACPTNAIVVDDPYVAYAKVAHFLTPVAKPKPGIHPTAVIAKDCDIHESVSIGPHCVVETQCKIAENVVIGAGCVIAKGCNIGSDSELRANVSLYHETQLGERVIIHSGAVIGSDGFGLANDNGTWVKKNSAI